MVETNPALVMIKPNFESKGPPIVDKSFNDKSHQKDSSAKSFL